MTEHKNRKTQTPHPAILPKWVESFSNVVAISRPSPCECFLGREHFRTHSIYLWPMFSISTLRSHFSCKQLQALLTQTSLTRELTTTMMRPSLPASSVKARGRAPKKTPFRPPMVAVYNIGVCSMDFRSNLKDRDRAEKGWEKLQSELQYLYRKTGLVFIQEAGPVVEKAPHPEVRSIVNRLVGGPAFGEPAHTRPPLGASRWPTPLSCGTSMRGTSTPPRSGRLRLGTRKSQVRSAKGRRGGGTTWEIPLG